MAIFAGKEERTLSAMIKESEQGPLSQKSIDSFVRLFNGDFNKATASISEIISQAPDDKIDMLIEISAQILQSSRESFDPSKNSEHDRIFAKIEEASTKSSYGKMTNEIKAQEHVAVDSSQISNDTTLLSDVDTPKKTGSGGIARLLGWTVKAAEVEKSKVDNHKPTVANNEQNENKPK